MKYKCAGDLNIWGWSDFKEAINAKLIDYDSDGATIDSITYEVEKPIDKKVCTEFGVKFKVLKD